MLLQAGLDPLDDESDSNDSEGGTTATSESVEVTVGEAADDIDTAKLVTVTRELPAMRGCRPPWPTKTRLEMTVEGI